MKNYDCKACAASARQSTTLTSWFKKLSRGGKERTEAATVCSHRVTTARFPTMDSTWNYLVTFTLENGESIELHTLEETYKALEVGMTGKLTWEGENLLNFETEG